MSSPGTVPALPPCHVWLLTILCVGVVLLVAVPVAWSKDGVATVVVALEAYAAAVLSFA